jgi:hypothetical protein
MCWVRQDPLILLLLPVRLFFFAFYLTVWFYISRFTQEWRYSSYCTVALLNFCTRIPTCMQSYCMKTRLRIIISHTINKIAPNKPYHDLNLRSWCRRGFKLKILIFRGPIGEGHIKKIENWEDLNWNRWFDWFDWFDWFIRGVDSESTRVESIIHFFIRFIRSDSFDSRQRDWFIHSGQTNTYIKYKEENAAVLLCCVNEDPRLSWIRNDIRPIRAGRWWMKATREWNESYRIQTSRMSRWKIETDVRIYILNHIYYNNISPGAKIKKNDVCLRYSTQKTGTSVYYNNIMISILHRTTIRALSEVILFVR